MVSAWSMMSTSAWPTPTVSRNTSSLPAASISSAACSAASLSPPSAPRLAIERMKTPGSRKCSVRRMRSPSSAPCVNGDDGSIDSTADLALGGAAQLRQRADQRRLADAGRAGEADDRRLPGVRVDLAHELPALRVVVLDERDRARQRALVAAEQALGEGRVCGHGPRMMPDRRLRCAWHRVARRPPRRSRGRRRRPSAGRAPRRRRRHGGPLTLLRFMRRNRMLNAELRAAAGAPGVAEAALPRAPADRRDRVRLPGRAARDRQGRRVVPSGAGRGSATARRSARTRARCTSARSRCSARSARSPPTSTSRSGASASSPTA